MFHYPSAPYLEDMECIFSPFYQNLYFDLFLLKPFKNNASRIKMFGGKMTKKIEVRKEMVRREQVKTKLCSLLKEKPIYKQ
jgi:hypothetical protein